MIKGFLWVCGAALAAVQPAMAEERRFTVGSFERVRVEGPVEVIIVTGSQPLALAEGDSRALAALDIAVRGNSLFVRSQRRAVLEEARRLSAVPPTMAKVFINARTVSSVTLVGPGRLSVDRIAGSKGSVVLDGPGTLSVGFADVSAFSISYSGSGKMTLAGKAQTVDAVLTGFGTVDAAELASADLDVTSEGFVTSRFAASNSARVGANGDTRIEIIGEPRCALRARGKAVILCGDGRPD